MNQSIGDATYEAKRDAYLSNSQNLLARSFHPLAYKNLPEFQRLLDRTGLPFRAYESFGPEQLAERQELYIRIAEWVWNPSRLDLEGEKPPTPELIVEHQKDVSNTTGRRDRREACFDFWQALLAHAKEVSDLHSRISASRMNWIGTRRHGQWWNYVVLQHETRVELYIDAPQAANNKALFDALCSDREAIEADFGTALYWQRLDDKRASRISFAVPGGWVDSEAWPSAVSRAVNAMQRLYDALSPRVQVATV